jgi:mannonate dehydratase
MNRRDFLTAGAAVAGVAGSQRAGNLAAAASRALMKVGATVQGGGGGGRGGPAEGQAAGRGIPAEAPPRARAAAADPDYGFRSLGRWGIKNVVATAEIADGRLYATVDELKRLVDRAGKYGISVDVLNPPFLPSSHIDRERNPAIMLGESPQRDRDIEQIQTMIRNCAAAGIPCIKYNMSILGVLRTGREPGRGDTTYSAYKLKDATPATPLTKAGVVTADRYWERITYFLDRVIPVANEYKVRMACHPNDSPVPPSGYQGVDAVLGTVEGLKKFVSIQESPYHGLNFCQGTVAEMLQDPGKEIYDVIRYFGSRKKIFMVHFRNIRGRRDDFMEVAIDEGDVNMFRAMQVYKEVGYDGMIMPDHAVQSPSETGGEYMAFCYGYIRALIQTVDTLG